MTEKERNDMVHDASAVIKKIQSQIRQGVIKDYMIPQLVSLETGKYIGFAVKLELSTRYDYDELLLTQWKKMLNADEWIISVKRCQLHVTFKVYYKKN